MISLADSDTDRAEIQTLFNNTFEDIAPNAVPATQHDASFDPVVLQFREDGRLVGAALTCRPQRAVAAAMMPSMAPPRLLEASRRISELDLIAVRPDRQGHGIGSQLITRAEGELLARDVRVWSGNVKADELRTFYKWHGFTVLSPGQRLPPLLGQEWAQVGAHLPAFYFYKRVGKR